MVLIATLHIVCGPWIKDVFTNQMQQLIPDNKQSNPCSVLSNVLQGTVLVLLLFLINIHHML